MMSADLEVLDDDADDEGDDRQIVFLSDDKEQGYQRTYGDGNCHDHSSCIVHIQLTSSLSMLCRSALWARMRFSTLCRIASLCSQRFSEGRIQLLQFECGRCLCCAGA